MEEVKRRRGCRTGCLVVLLLLLLLLGWVLAMRWGALERLGLRKPIAEQVFSPPPDRAAAAAITQALEQSGMNTQGIAVHVLPMASGEGSVALFTLDASQGFDPERLLAGAGDWEALEHLLSDQSLEEMNITRLAVDYANEEGKSIIVLTADASELHALSNRDAPQEEVMQAIKGYIDLPALLGEVAP